jgi:hypothetical protein
MNIKILSHIYTGKSLAIVFTQDGRTQTKIVESSHPNWRQIYSLYKQGKYIDIIPLFDVSQAVNAKFKGSFVVRNGKVYYGNEVVHGYLFDRILFFMREGLPYLRLVKFAENLYSNTSKTAITELYNFLEHKNMPITEDGCFLAYKGVDTNYYSKTAGSAKVLKGQVKNGRIFNGVGEVIEVDRESVNSDRSVGCSYGLHAGSWSYANDFRGNGPLMVVKINPRDVVSVPDDCSCQKLRTCRYEVIAEEGRKLSEIRDVNYDKVAKVRRDSQGRFVGAQKFNRDSLGRFCS